MEWFLHYFLFILPALFLSTSPLSLPTSRPLKCNITSERSCRTAGVKPLLDESGGAGTHH
jgi:hypothetical protein